MRTITAMGTTMLKALGGIFSLGAGERMDSSIRGVAFGHRSSPFRVRSSAFFMGPMSHPVRPRRGPAPEPPWRRNSGPRPRGRP